MDIFDFEWKTQYEVGNLEIDAEHKVFLRIIEKIDQAGKRNSERDYINRLVLELYKYADFHFCSEENVMLAAGYPDLHSHHEQHKKLLIELKTLIPVIEQGDQGHKELVPFLINWFANHTVAEDKKLADYINA